VGIGLNVLVFDFTLSFTQPRLVFNSAGHASEILSLAWNPLDSSALASVSILGPQQLFIWDTINGTPTVSAPLPQTGALSWGCYTNQLVGVAGIGIRVIDISTGNQTRPYGQSLVRGTASAVMCSPNGEKIAVGTVFDGVQVFDISAGVAIAISDFPDELPGVTDMITAIDWSSDNRTLARAGLDGVVRVWDTVTNELLDTVETGNSLYNLDWNPVSNELAYGGDNRTFQIFTPDLDSDL
jgi:WD40 repeat protein